MATTYLMRGYDPAGMDYVYWISAAFDSLGSNYTGPPAFNTLVGVTTIQVKDSGGDDARIGLSDQTSTNKAYSTVSRSEPQFIIGEGTGGAGNPASYNLSANYSDVP